MSYVDQDDEGGSYRGSSLKIGALVATLFVAYIVAPIVKPYFSRQASYTQLAGEGGADAALARDPAIGAAMATLKTHFAADYAKLTAAIQNGAAHRDEAAITQSVGAMLASVFTRDAGYLAQAPNDALVALQDRERAVVDQMRQTPKICAAFVRGQEVALPDAMIPTTAALADARLRAIAAGRDSPAGRAIKPLPAAGAAAFSAAVNAQAPSREVMEYLAGERRETELTDAGLCDAHRFFLRALEALPTDSRSIAYLGSAPA